MTFWPDNLTDWVDIVTKGLATLFAVVGGGWGLYQYFRSTRLRAAETLLKVEEEFRTVFPIYEEIEDLTTYRTSIKPVLDATELDDAGFKKLTQVDRCLRFLYLCSVLNDVLRADSALGVKGGALRRAYYYYVGILLPEERNKRPELLAYTDLYYPRLTAWVGRQESELRAARNPPNLPSAAIPASPVRSATSRSATP